jgi:hypothetical protein
MILEWLQKVHFKKGFKMMQGQLQQFIDSSAKETNLCARHRFNQWLWLIAVCVVGMGFDFPALGDSPASRPSAQDLATPRSSLIAYDHWCVDLGDFDDANAFYSEANDHEKAYAQLCLKADRVSAAIERQSRKTFGQENCTAILHEFGEADVSDLLSASITINGNSATVYMPAIQFQLQMIKASDGWIVDTSYLIQMYGGFDSAMQSLTAQIAKLQPIADGLGAGKFKTAQEVIHAIDQAIGGKQG